RDPRLSRRLRGLRKPGAIRVDGRPGRPVDRDPDEYLLGPGLADVLALRPVDFRWKERPDGGPQIGLIAQEVAEVIPEAIVPPSDSDEYYGLSYTELIPVLIRAIQEQQVEIEVLRGRVAMLEGQPVH
ncbi:MAG: tail fiber domain-containing protein, partial [Rhodothermales bacterium]|nr:tail fiber domain-containing protein [Rhodothermales bacterium]